MHVATLLERFGGHHMAAGLNDPAGRLEAFRNVSTASVRPADAGELGPEQRVDIELPLCEAKRRTASGSAVTWNTYRRGNPGPVLR
jgi:single-stranded DNA-specific DHH superfamily exonuclease